jgi:hypothetical protein
VVAANAYAPVSFLCWLPDIVIAEYIIVVAVYPH